MKLDKGPAEYLRALASGDPERIAEAKEFQRESFRVSYQGAGTGGAGIAGDAGF